MYQTKVVLPLLPQAARTPAAVAMAAMDPAARRRRPDRREGEAPRDRLGTCMMRSLHEKVNKVTSSPIHRSWQALTDPIACACAFGREHFVTLGRTPMAWR